MYVKKDSGLVEVVERGGPQDICAEGDYMMSVERRGKQCWEKDGNFCSRYA